MMLLQALWSLAATAALCVFAAAGMLVDEQALVLLLTGGILGCALGLLRTPRLVQLAAASLVPAAIAVPAAFAWIPDAVFPVPGLVALCTMAAFGLTTARPQFERPGHSIPRPALAAVVRAVFVALAALVSGVVATLSIAAALTFAAVVALAWVVVYAMAPQPKFLRRESMHPTELLQAAIVAAGVGGWAVLSLVIADQVGITDGIIETGTPALPIAAAVAAGALGAGLGAAGAHLTIRSGMRMLPSMTLVVTVIGMALVMVARPDASAVFAVVGILIAAAGLGATMTSIDHRPPVEQTTPLPADTASITKRLLASEAVLARFAAPAITAAMAFGALIGGLLGTVVEERDALIVSLAAVAASALWVAVRRSMLREKTD